MRAEGLKGPEARPEPAPEASGGGRAAAGRRAERIERLFWRAPWLLLACPALGALPAYFWWLFTGDSRAGEWARWGVVLGAAFALAAMACITPTVPYAFLARGEGPSAAHRLLFAAVGAVLWAEAALLVVAFLDADKLTAARAATAAFFAGIPLGLAAQRLAARRAPDGD